MKSDAKDAEKNQMENDERYFIENLGKVFAEHAEISQKNDEHMIREFKENYPDSELPEHFINPFSIAKALSIMAYEIQKLMNKND